MVAIGQSTIEKLAWWVVFLILLVNIAIFVKLSNDSNQKFHQLKANQNQIFCVIKAPPTLATAPRVEQIKFIDNCISSNQ